MLPNNSLGLILTRKRKRVSNKEKGHAFYKRVISLSLAQAAIMAPFIPRVCPLPPTFTAIALQIAG
jgi:hypothetical protein